MNKAIKILIITVMIGLISLVSCNLGPPWKITQKDVDREGNRWWVIYYKMLEDEIPGQTSEFIAGKGGVDVILEKEFGKSFVEYTNNVNLSLRDEYYYTKRRNELMEKALIKFKGEEALKEIEGKYSLEEAYGSLEKANKAINVEEDDRNGMLEKLLESIDSGNYENFKKDLNYDLKEKFTEEEFNKLVNEVKEKYGEYKIYSTESISSSTGSGIKTAYFYTIYSKNQKVKIMIKFSLEIEIYKIADFRFGS